MRGIFFMKSLKQNGNMILLIFIEIVVGILLLINPVNFTTGIIIMFGILLMAGGLFHVIQYFKTNPEDAAMGRLLMRGLVLMLAGAFCAFNSQWFILTFPVIAVLYGIAILAAGLNKIQMAADLLRLQYRKWWWAAVSAAVTILCAVTIISNPFTTTDILWRFTGISLIVNAIFDILAAVKNRGGRQTQEERQCIVEKDE